MMNDKTANNKQEVLQAGGLLLDRRSENATAGWGTVSPTLSQVE
jgi:hypothetical protein